MHLNSQSEHRNETSEGMELGQILQSRIINVLFFQRSGLVKIQILVPQVCFTASILLSFFIDFIRVTLVYKIIQISAIKFYNTSSINCIVCFPPQVSLLPSLFIGWGWRDRFCFSHKPSQCQFCCCVDHTVCSNASESIEKIGPFFRVERLLGKCNM